MFGYDVAMHYKTIDTSLIDQLQELIGGDRAALLELIQTFIEEGADINAQSLEAVENTDIDLLRRSAHSLKSSAQDFGAGQLSRLCATLEAGCKHEWPEDAAEQSRLIDDEYQRVASELQHYLENA